YRQIGWLLALEDAIDIGSCAPVLVEPVGSIGDQAAVSGIEAGGVDGGQLVLGGGLEDEITMNRRRCTPPHDQTAIRGAREGRDGALDLPGAGQIDRVHLYPE